MYVKKDNKGFDLNIFIVSIKYIIWSFSGVIALICLKKDNISGLNASAVFSDETKYYRNIIKTSKGFSAEIKIRTAESDADKICVVTDRDIILMTKKESINGFDYYFCNIDLKEKITNYYFEINHGIGTYFYSKFGVSKEVPKEGYFTLIPNFDIPDWIKGAVMYQIYVDRFFNGDKTNDVKTGEYVYLNKHVIFKDDWYEYPSSEDIRNFYGGDLQGVIDKLPYLKNLGVEAIYFNPVFVSPSNHKYDIQDYNHVDPHIGVIVNDNDKVLQKGEHTNKNADCYILRTTDKENLEKSDILLAELINKAHENGIRVILDGVFNHCGAFNKWLDAENIYRDKDGISQGAYENKNSPYMDYFIWNDDGSYQCWWGLKNHPKLNYEGSENLMNEITEVTEKWIKEPFCADGWRIDVGADLGQSEEYNHFFWKKFRQTVKETNKEAVILAEHYGDASLWLKGDEWDTVMNYDAFMEPVSYFFTGMEKHSDYFNNELYNNGKAFEETMIKNMAKLPYESLVSAMNQLSNHDHSRFLTRTNMTEGRVASNGSVSAEKGINKDIFKEAVLMQMTWIGAPTVYYGDEAGLAGWTDPDNRRTYPWGREDKELIDFHKKAIDVRKKYTVLKDGSLIFLNAHKGIVAYGRFGNGEILVSVFNNNEEKTDISIPVWKCEAEEGQIFEVILTTGEFSEKKFYEVTDGNINIKAGKRCGVLLYYGN